MRKNKFLWVLNYNTGQVYVGEYSETYLNVIGVETIIENMGFFDGDCHWMISDKSEVNEVNTITGI